jgi:hypothetical protein
MSVYDQKLIPEEMKKYCVSPHWDANAIFRHTVPQTNSIPLPITPRPYTKINLEYRTSAPFEEAPSVPQNFVFTGASDKYPSNRYLQNIDYESALERLDRPLNRDPVPSSCPGVPYYLPSDNGTMFSQRSIIDEPRRPIDSTMEELEVPKAIRNISEYDCHRKELMCDVAANTKVWFNVTRMQKYNQRDTSCGNRYDYVNGQDASTSRLPKVWDTPTD